MPKQIIETSVNYWDKISNSPYFLGDPSNSFTGNIGNSFKFEGVYQVGWATDRLKFGSDVAPVGNPVFGSVIQRFDGGSFVNDGFSAGDNVRFITIARVEWRYKPPYGTSYAANRIPIDISLTISNVTPDTITFAAPFNLNPFLFASGTPAENMTSIRYFSDIYDCYFVAMPAIQGFEYLYNFVENDSQFNESSIIDGTTTGYYKTNAFTNGYCTPISSNIKSNKGSDTLYLALLGYAPQYFEIENVGFTIATAFQRYRIRHDFLLLPYKEEWIEELINGTQPDEFAGSKSLKHVRKISFFNSYSNKQSARSKIFDFQKGNIGFVGENYNGGENTYEITSVKIYDNNGDEIDDIDIAGCNVKIRVRSKVSTVTAGASVNGRMIHIYHVTHKNAAEYENSVIPYINGVLYYDTFIDLNNVTAFDQGNPRMLYVSSTFINDYNFEVEIRINLNKNLSIYPQTFPEEGDLYGLYLAIGNNRVKLTEPRSALGNASLFNTVTLKVKTGSYIKNTDIPNLWFTDRNEIYDHPTLATEIGYTNYAGYIEDGILFYTENRLKKSSRLLSARAMMVAEKGKEYFEIYGYNLDLSSQIIANGYQNFTVDTTVEFNLNEDDQFNRLVIQTTGSNDDFSFIKMQVPFKIPWQSWQSLPSVDPVFYENNPQTQFGLNRKTDRYSGQQGYEVKMYLLLEIEEQGIITQYLDKSPEFEIKDYEFGEFDWAINTFDSSDESLSGGILTNETTFVEAIFTKEDHGLEIGELCGVIRIEEQRAQGIGIHELSTINETYVGNPLEPISGEFATIEVTSTDVIKLKCKINHTLLTNSNYRLSARLFPKESAPLNPEFNLDYNLDYDS
jgi:hypothetical protein